MQNYIKKRVRDIAEYILESEATVRDTAYVFGVSRTTVHKDVSIRLPEVDPKLAEEVENIMRKNKEESHIRGGEATKRKHQLENK